MLLYIVRLMSKGIWTKRIDCKSMDEVNKLIQIVSEDTETWYERYMIETRDLEKDMPIDIEFDNITHTMDKTRNKGR